MMKAIILAAGYATRLYPITKDFPKALLSVAGKSMLDHLADGIAAIGEIDRVFIVSNDKFYPNFADWRDRRGDPRFEVINDGTDENGERLGAIGDMIFTIGKEGIDEDLLVVAGDNYLRIDLAEVYRRYVALGRKTLLLGQRTADMDMLRRFAVARVDGDGKVLDLIEKPERPAGDLAIFALYFYPRGAVAKLRVFAAQGNPLDAPGNFPQWLHSREDVYVYTTTEPCFDIGTPESLAYVRELYGE